MTPDPNRSALDAEIDAALSGVNLQEVSAQEESPSSPKLGLKDGLMDGVVAGVHADDVIVDLGPRMQGVASLREFDEPPAVGSKLRFMVRGREEGLWVLSLKAAQALAAWDELEAGSLVKARVTGHNTGGLELKIGTNDAFMPASQVSLQRTDDISAFLGQTVTAEVLEVNRERRRVVLSRRKVQEREQLEALSQAVGKLHPGVKLGGKVSRIESFGAFVDLGNGVEGLVHVSNISRKRIENPADTLQVGQDVQVQVLEIKENGKKIGLGMKQLEPDPWDEVEHKYAIDRQVTGTVTRLMDFGAFVELEPGLEGLLHVSQLGRERVRKVSDVVSIGEELTVRVTAIERSAGRMSLSRLDSRGAVLGSEEAVDASVIDNVLAKPAEGSLGTSLGSLFRKALEGKKPN